MGGRMISKMGGEVVRLKPQERKGAKNEEKQRFKQVTPAPHRIRSSCNKNYNIGFITLSGAPAQARA